jgi:hypothetical protein
MAATVTGIKTEILVGTGIKTEILVGTGLSVANMATETAIRRLDDYSLNIKYKQYERFSPPSVFKLEK